MWQHSAVGGGAAGYGLGSVNWSGVGNALGNAGRWMGNGFQTGWSPLTKELLYDYVKNQACQNCDENKIHREVGYYFEDVWNFYANVNLKEYNYQAHPIIPGTEDRPDGMSDTFADDYENGRLIRRTVHKNAALYEMKARNGRIYTSSDEYQIPGYVQLAASLNPVAALDNAAAMNIVTTSNMTISSKIKRDAWNIGVNVRHIVSYYRVNKSGTYSIKFYARTPIIDTPSPKHRGVIVPITIR